MGGQDGHIGLAALDQLIDDRGQQILCFDIAGLDLA